MTDTCNFVLSLFEKSKILNDMNTEFLKTLEFGELPINTRIELFYKNTMYHENILKTIAEIVKDLDKTEILLDPTQRALLEHYRSLDDFTQKKLSKILEFLTATKFVPKYLSTCPKCGGKMVGNGDIGCKKIPLSIGGQNIGYTYRCMKKEVTNEPE